MNNLFENQSVINSVGGNTIAWLMDREYKPRHRITISDEDSDHTKLFDSKQEDEGEII